MPAATTTTQATASAPQRHFLDSLPNFMAVFHGPSFMAVFHGRLSAQP